MDSGSAPWRAGNDKGSGAMAERKAALRRAPARPELEELLRQAKSAVLTDDDLQEQYASFIYGNAPKNSRITKDSARAAVRRVRLLTSR